MSLFNFIRLELLNSQGYLKKRIKRIPLEHRELIKKRLLKLRESIKILIELETLNKSYFSDDEEKAP